MDDRVEVGGGSLAWLWRWLGWVGVEGGSFDDFFLAAVHTKNGLRGRKESEKATWTCSQIFEQRFVRESSTRG